MAKRERKTGECRKEMKRESRDHVPLLAINPCYVTHQILIIFDANADCLTNGRNEQVSRTYSDDACSNRAVAVVFHSLSCELARRGVRRGAVAVRITRMTHALTRPYKFSPVHVAATSLNAADRL